MFQCSVMITSEREGGSVRRRFYFDGVKKKNNFRGEQVEQSKGQRAKKNRKQNEKPLV